LYTRVLNPHKIHTLQNDDTPLIVAGFVIIAFSSDGKGTKPENVLAFSSICSSVFMPLSTVSTFGKPAEKRSAHEAVPLPGAYSFWLAYYVESFKNISINAFNVSSTADGYRLPDEYEWRRAAVGSDKGGNSSISFKKMLFRRAAWRSFRF
jgi:hypothetical protein